MTIHPSHFGCIKSAVSTGLRQMYIDDFCPGLGTCIKVSDLSVRPLVIDPKEGCCITRCTFLFTHIIPRVRDKLKRLTKESFHVFSFDDIEEKVVVRFEGEKGQDAIYEITLCTSVFECDTSSIRDYGALQNGNYLKFILNGDRNVPPL